MADNSVNLATPTGIVAADDIGGILYQRVKIGWGADSTWNETADTAGKEIPVKIASSQMGSLGQSAPATSVPVVPAYLEYETVAASQTNQMLGATGNVADYIEGLICVVGTAATSLVQLKDGNGTAFDVLPNAVGGGVGTYYVPLGLKCVNATTPGWQVTTGAGVKVIATGKFHLMASSRRAWGTLRPPTVASAGVPLAVSWTANGPTTSATGTNVSYGTLAIGAADANRVVAAFVANRNTSVVSYATSVTVGGVSMTSYDASKCTFGLTAGQWWYGSIPTGTTASVAAVYPQGTARSIVEIYRVITDTPAPAAAGAVAGNLTSVNTSITVPTGGVGLAGTFWRNPSVLTGINWTNATADHDAVLDSIAPFSSATVTGTGSVSVTAAIPSAVASDVVLSMAAWVSG